VCHQKYLNSKSVNSWRRCGQK